VAYLVKKENTFYEISRFITFLTSCSYRLLS